MFILLPAINFSAKSFVHPCFSLSLTLSLSFYFLLWPKLVPTAYGYSKRNRQKRVPSSAFCLYINIQLTPLNALLTRYDFKLSTTHANSASRPIVTVMFGMGSANRGKFDSAKSVSINVWLSGKTMLQLKNAQIKMSFI